MNIFVLDSDPAEAARLHCNAHVVKMIVESAQMLSTAHRMIDGTESRRLSASGKTWQKYYELHDPRRENLLYKAVHRSHPCTVWTMEAKANYLWHFKLYDALCAEYTYRYGKVHKSQQLRDELARPPANLCSDRRTPHPLAMGAAPECKNPNDPISSYRKFYKTKAARFKMVWTKRPTPTWFKLKRHDAAAA